MPDLTPVDNDPFANQPPPGIPVDHDPFQSQQLAPPSGLAQQVSGFPQRAADLGMAALGPIGEAGMTVGDMLRTGHVDPRDIPQVAGGVMLGVAAPEAEEAAPLEAGAEAVAKGITAYHGSPYDFDKFDLSKIGTGEGAQAYGHGLYFAENPGTAQSYRDSLSDLKPRAIEGQPDLTLPSWIAKKVESHNPIAINDVRADFKNRLAEMQRQVSDPSTPQPWLVEGNIPGIQNILSALDHVESGAKIAPAGRMYQVSINADPEHFLDWDKPLSEQSPQVQKALTQLGYFGEGRTPSVGYQKMAGDYGGPDMAATMLHQAGIPGIKYLDQGSRGSGNGTSNYVVFDDKLIDIVKKYGMAGLIAGGAAHFSTTPVDYNPFEGSGT